MLELLFLLLPLAVMYGWYIGFRYARRDIDKEETDRTQKFMSGVRFLLAGKKLKASEVLTDLLHVDSENFDANLALADVYRSRGDVDKAIQIHRHLLDSSLPRIKLDLASYEMAKDYIAVGLYDKAIALLQDLKYDNDIRIKAIRLTVKVHQKLGDWDPALEIIRRNASDLPEKYTVSYRAQFMCEKAKDSADHSRQSEAEMFLRQALHIDPSCVRARIMLADLLSSRGDCDEAASFVSPVADYDPATVMIALPVFKKCFRLPAENERYTEALKDWLDKSDSSTLVLEIASVIEQYDLNEAMQFILQNIRRKGTLRVFERLMDYQIREARDQDSRERLTLLQNLVNTEIAMHKNFVCSQCGFSSKTMFWNCPSCSEWNSIRPVKGLDGD
ncbi:MAG: tetratricopeptide repeat protein [Succinivibrionaceae bacterium]|nr:tetratricopeptide repeat protein [Succinivibrionaceae bacterium]